ncbi:MAG: Cold shock protein CspA [Nitrospira sp.]|nr:Cold shock protein CspA [Nitrospira sp.]
MTQGTIKKLVTDRGFGFIVPDEATADGKDLFFHRADVQNSSYDALREGQHVTYTLGTDERKGTPKATQVQAA